jgi:uncharacterized protein YkwD
VLRKRYIYLLFAVGSLVFSAAPAVAGTQVSTTTSLLHAVNATRTAHHLRPLRLDARLQRAARAHTVEMLRGDFFSHGDFYGRMVRFHLSGSLGENLAWGSGSYARARSIVRMWLASPAHRANLLRRGYRRIGFGIRTGSFQGTSGATVVTADFGS